MPAHREESVHPSHDATLTSAVRRMQGAYYTPSAIVEEILARLLPIRRPVDFTLLDPACGDGAFLCGVLEYWCGNLRSETCPTELPKWLYGIDRDPTAVAMARQRVARTVLGAKASATEVEQLADQLQRNIVVGDALLDAWPQHWPEHFSAVVGNPPYVNIRRLARDAAQVAQYRERFRTAHKAFDLYILFLERAWELLAPSGRCGFLVPNKVATLEYAEKCRELLGKQSQIEVVLDYSRCQLFPAASVYPWAILFQKRTPSTQHRVRVTTFEMGSHAQPIATTSCNVLQKTWRAQRYWSWPTTECMDSPIPTKPLGEVCRLHSGTTGFVAQQMRAALQEHCPIQPPCFDFIVSGNIDPYCVSLGNVRYMQQKYVRPVLPIASGVLTENKRRLFREPKIVIAGMSKHLEAAWDPGGVALGVQVFAAAEFQVDPFLLLALLNSKFYTNCFQARFCAKRLAGGYFSINKGQLAQLPVPDLAALNSRQRQHTQQLARLAKACVQAGSKSAEFTAMDAEINALVARLYQLSPRKIDENEALKPERKAV